MLGIGSKAFRRYASIPSRRNYGADSKDPLSYFVIFSALFTTVALFTTLQNDSHDTKITNLEKRVKELEGGRNNDRGDGGSARL